MQLPNWTDVPVKHGMQIIYLIVKHKVCLENHQIFTYVCDMGRKLQLFEFYSFSMNVKHESVFFSCPFRYDINCASD